MTDPIELPDGVYTWHDFTGLADIRNRAEIAIDMANDIESAVFLVFNGSSVRVAPGSDVDTVCRLWKEHRETYQNGE